MENKNTSHQKKIQPKEEETKKPRIVKKVHQKILITDNDIKTKNKEKNPMIKYHEISEEEVKQYVISEELLELYGEKFSEFMEDKLKFLLCQNKEFIEETEELTRQNIPIKIGKVTIYLAPLFAIVSFVSMIIMFFIFRIFK